MRESPAQTLENAIFAWRRDEAALRIEQAILKPNSRTHRQLARAHRRLRSAEALERFDSVFSRGDIEKHQAGAMLAHLKKAAVEDALASARDAIVESANEPVMVRGESMSAVDLTRAFLSKTDPATLLHLESAARDRLAQLTPRLRDARDYAQESLAPIERAISNAPARPDLNDDATTLSATVARVLSDSNDAAEEAVALLSKELAPRPITSAWSLLAAVGTADFAKLFAREHRTRRVSDCVAPLGLHRELQSRVRVVESKVAVHPFVRLAILDPAADLRLILPAVEYGLASEMLVMEAAIRALMISLSSPALPFSLRYPLDASVARSLGGLFAGLLGAPRVLSAFGLDRKSQQRVERAIRSTVLLDTRLALTAFEAKCAPREDISETAHRLSHALSDVAVDFTTAELVVRTPTAQLARVRAKLGAFALAHVLRERFDEDWFRNPRAGELIRAFASRGGSISIEALLAENGASLATACEWLNEMWR